MALWKALKRFFSFLFARFVCGLVLFCFLNPQQAHSLLILKLEAFGVLLLSLPVSSLEENLWWQSWHSTIVFIIPRYASGEADTTSPPYFRP